MLRTKMITLASLLLELSTFLCLSLISCRLCKSSTLWIILILLMRNVEQAEKACCIAYKNDNSGSLTFGVIISPSCV